MIQSESVALFAYSPFVEITGLTGVCQNELSKCRIASLIELVTNYDFLSASVVLG